MAIRRKAHNMPIQVRTPVGRIVWGNPAKAVQKKDNVTKQPRFKADGSPMMQYSFGLAIPKFDFEATVWPAMFQEAATVYPHGTPPKFAWKYQDGDGIDSQGKPFAEREGYAGHIVLAISTEIPPGIFKLNAAGTGYDVVPPEGIKCGDYVSVALRLVANKPTDPTHTPGLFVNPEAIEFVGYGQPIVSGPDPDELFGKQRHALPPGASATPVQATGAPGMPVPGQPAPAAAPQPGMPAPGYGAPPPVYGQPAPGMQPGMPAPGGYAPQPGMPAPAHDFVHNATGQPAPGMQPGMPAPGMQPGMPAPGYAAPPPAPGGYAPQPGQMPGMPGVPR
jgi:hypothetical protein